MMFTMTRAASLTTAPKVEAVSQARATTKNRLLRKVRDSVDGPQPSEGPLSTVRDPQFHSSRFSGVHTGPTKNGSTDTRDHGPKFQSSRFSGVHTGPPKKRATDTKPHSSRFSGVHTGPTKRKTTWDFGPTPRKFVQFFLTVMLLAQCDASGKCANGCKNPNFTEAFSCNSSFHNEGTKQLCDSPQCSIPANELSEDTYLGNETTTRFCCKCLLKLAELRTAKERNTKCESISGTKPCGRVTVRGASRAKFWHTTGHHCRRCFKLVCDPCRLEVHGQTACRTCHLKWCLLSRPAEPVARRETVATRPGSRQKAGHRRVHSEFRSFLPQHFTESGPRARPTSMQARNAEDVMVAVVKRGSLFEQQNEKL